jgi:hypothetical protein
MNYGNTLDTISDYIATQMGRADDKVFIRLVRYSVKYWRAFLLRQHLERNKNSELYFQSIVRELEPTKKFNYNATELESTHVKVTTVAIPEIIKFNGREPFNYVGSSDFTRPFTFLRAEDIAYFFDVKYGKNNRVGYFPDGDKIYIFSCKNVGEVLIRHAFFDFDVVQRENDEQSCEDIDVNMRMPSDKIHTIVLGLLSGEFSFQNDKADKIETE